MFYGKPKFSIYVDVAVAEKLVAAAKSKRKSVNYTINEVLKKCSHLFTDIISDENIKLKKDYK